MRCGGVARGFRNWWAEMNLRRKEEGRKSHGARIHFLISIFGTRLEGNRRLEFTLSDLGEFQESSRNQNS